jgi:t-SNARE complex subunit (syntaxin)
LKGTQDRLAKLRSSVERETRNISETLETEISELRQEIADSEEEISSQRERLDELRAELEERAAVSENGRKALSKAMKELDDVQKEIGEWVRRARWGHCLRICLIPLTCRTTRSEDSLPKDSRFIGAARSKTSSYLSAPVA